jgi:hypothetical protein
MKPRKRAPARRSQQRAPVRLKPYGIERRGLDRPKNGDVSACPQCARGAIEFNERYRWLDGPVPAWICDSAACGYRQIVRGDARPANLSKLLIRKSKAVDASARRSAMRSRARTTRSEQHIRDTKARVKRGGR